MTYNWIDAPNYSMDTLLLFDRWTIRYIMAEQPCIVCTTETTGDSATIKPIWQEH